MSTRLDPTLESVAPPAERVPADKSAPAWPPPTSPAQRPRRRRWWLLLIALLALLAGAVVVANLVAVPAPTPTPTVTAGSAGTTIRGRVQPVAQARVASLTGGVLVRLAVAAGDAVQSQQEIARVRGADGAIEVVTAPWAGTIISRPVSQGDTVQPGTLIGIVADLSQLQVETTDVDEFVIGRLSAGMPVTMTIDALDRQERRGQIKSVSLTLQASSSGDDHYPVIIALAEAPDGLRPGMTVRIRLAPTG